MSGTVTVHVTGTPVPYPRMTGADRRGRGRPRAPVRRYAAWASTLRLAYREQCGVLLQEPLGVELLFRRRRLNCDLDNLIKGVLDALTREAWKDDRATHIRLLKARFRQVLRPEDEGVEITVRPLGPEALKVEGRLEDEA